MAEVKMPPVQTEYFPLVGGLNVIDPQIAIKPGVAIGAANYEVAPEGGYSRVGGYERFDGRPKPSDADFTVLFATTTFSTTVAAGQTITGGTSNASAKIIIVSQDRKYVVVTRQAGVFQLGENLKVSSVTVAVNGASNTDLTQFDDNKFAEAAANDYRTDIQAPPGSGPVRGVWSMKDEVYCFRDNAAATQCLMYKATGGGWTQVSLGFELKFNSGDTGTAIVDGQTVTGGTSGATGVVKRVVVQSGSNWAAATPCSGRLIFASITGTFQNGEDIKVSGVRRATCVGTQSAITLQPGGRFEFDNYNFTGSADTLRMYGCDGVNRGFEFDGNVFVPIETGMTQDKPKFVRCHKGHLFFAFRGSLQHSSIGEPYRWSVVVGGASELGLGDECTGLQVVSGSEGHAALMVFCRNRIRVLYGNSSADWNLVALSDTTGALPYTTQLVVSPVFLDDLGITTSDQSASFGNFEQGIISDKISPLLSGIIADAVASTVVRTRNQYKLFFKDGYGITVTFRGRQIIGIMPFNLPVVANCTCNAEINGKEVILFGATNGFVYELNKGRSFDGGEIQATLRPAFNHSRTPRTRKRYRKAIFELKPTSACTLSIQPEFSYGNGDAQTHTIWDQSVTGLGGRWDTSNWDRFYWDSNEFTSIEVKLDGVGTNISFTIISKTSNELPHTIQGVTLHYTPRRLER
jgi:hypothetical protein